MDPFLSNLFVQLRRKASTTWTRASDAELLSRFVRSQEDAAFELLFWRHGPLVWSVCRRLLGDSADAEDAFQATFVVLARKGKSVGDGSAVAGWLHQVAWRASINARKARARRAAHEARAAQGPSPCDNCDPTKMIADQELTMVVDLEIASLPMKYRLPLVLCDLEGRSRESAAAELQCSLGTLHSRLARGREKLKGRLLRRGLALPTLAATALPVDVASAALQSLSQQRSVAVAALVDGVLKSMALSTAKKLAGALALCCLLAAGVAWGIRPDLHDAIARPMPIAAVQGKKEVPVNFIDRDLGPLPKDAVARIGSTRFRHDGDVSKLAYSRDGKWLASMSIAPQDATARLWDAATGREKLRVKLDQPAFGQMPSALGFTAEGKQFLVLDTTSIRSFDIVTGKEFFAHPHQAAGQQNVEAKRPKGGNPPQAKGRNRLQAGAIAPDGKSYVLSWNDGTFEVRDLPSGAIRKKGSHPFTKYLSCLVQFSPDSRRFLLIVTDDHVPVYDAASAEHISVVSAKDKCFLETFLLAGSDELVAKISDDRGANPIVAVFDVKSGKILRNLAGDWNTHTIAISPDGKVIVAAHAYKEFAQLLNLETGKEIGRIPMPYSSVVLTFSPDGKTLAGAFFGSGAIIVWDVQKGSMADTAAEPASFAGTIFSRDSNAVVIGWAATAIVDWRTGNVIRRLANVAPDRPSEKAFLSPDQKFYAILEKNKSIRLVDSGTLKELRVIEGLKALPLRAEFSQDSHRLVSFSTDNSLRVWDLASGREIAEFYTTEQLNQPGLFLSDNGRILATKAWSQGKGAMAALYTWDVDTPGMSMKKDCSLALKSLKAVDSL
jgi:RNA polymerase sigma factor (sigma-70 family)